MAKKMSEVKVDIIAKTITVTKGFYKRASDPNSQEYDELQRILVANPNCKLVKREIKKNPNKESYAVLNYDFMREYVKTHVEVSKVVQAMEDLEEQIYLSKCHSTKFPKVRKWFLETYPEIKDNYGKVSETKKTVKIITSENEFEDLCA